MNAEEMRRLQQRQKQKNTAVAWLVVGFVALIFVITIVKYLFS